MLSARTIRGAAALTAVVLLLATTTTQRPLSTAAQASQPISPPWGTGAPETRAVAAPRPLTIPNIDMAGLTVPKTQARPRLESAVDQYISGYGIQQYGLTR